MEDYELNAVLNKINIYDKYTNTLLILRDNEVHKLKDYIDTQNEKIKQLSKALVNVTKELEELEL